PSGAVKLIPPFATRPSGKNHPSSRSAKATGSNPRAAARQFSERVESDVIARRGGVVIHAAGWEEASEDGTTSVAGSASTGGIGSRGWGTLPVGGSAVCGQPIERDPLGGAAARDR